MAPVEAFVFKSPEQKPDVVRVSEGQSETLILAGKAVHVNWPENSKSPTIEIDEPDNVRVIQRTTLGDSIRDNEVPSGQKVSCGTSPYGSTLIIHTLSNEALVLQYDNPKVLGVYQNHRKD